MAEKKCKHCAMSIPEAAKTCPYCRKSQPQSVKWWQLVVLCAFGWMVYTCASSISTFQSYKDKAEARKTELENVPLTSKGKKVKSKHPNWDNETCNTVADKRVNRGMTAEQAQAAWGKPYKINETNYGNHVHEQWVMHKMGSSYLYFEDGILTTIQTSR